MNFDIADAYARYRYTGEKYDLYQGGSKINQEVAELLAEASRRDDRAILDYIAEGGTWMVLCPHNVQFWERMKTLGLSRTSPDGNKNFRRITLLDHALAFDRQKSKVLVTELSRNDFTAIQYLRERGFTLVIEWWR
jgi:hypothetical protein